jgi:hypothetical protein
VHSGTAFLNLNCEKTTPIKLPELTEGLVGNFLGETVTVENFIDISIHGIDYPHTA